MINLKDIQPDIARIDIERVGETTIFVRVWKVGFNPSDAGSPAFEDMLDGQAESMSGLCSIVEAQGFSITMNGSKKARALRGPVTRIDFVKQVDGWHIKKYPRGWRASTKPMSDVIKSDEEINAAIAWCRTNGWSIRDFRGEIIRAWKGNPVPVHTAETTRRLREKYPNDRLHNFLFDG
ncbi:MAG: hypothetical protein IPL32_17980 [Chloracidobacterium sp.]|nr:hypothetical protein [Chloracidobacterium sp.]